MAFIHSPRVHQAALALALCSGTALALTADLTRVNGVLGTSVTYQMQGDPFEVYVLLPSLTTGPTPIAIVDPIDPRVLNVGLDLVALWKFGVLNGSGQAGVTYILPNDPTLHGISLHAQFVTLPGATTLVDEISDLTSFKLGQAGKSTFTVGQKPEELDGHTQSLLNDGRVLIAGGSTTVASQNVALATFRVFDPQTQGFAATSGTMQHPRAGHAAVKLNDGRVLLIGGGDQNGTIVATCDIWNPTTGLSTPAASMSTARGQHSATLLPNGKVFVAGGIALLNTADIVATINSAQSSTEVYDPATNAWSAGPSMPKPRVGHTATLLGNGQVLIAAGVEVTSILFVNIPDFSSDCRRYNPGTNTMSSAAAIPGARGFHAAAALSNGNACVVGGVDGDPVLLSFTVLNSARIYNAGGNSWSSVASMANPRAYPSLLDVNGKLVVIGGLSTFDIATTSGTPVLAIETASEAVTSWSSTGNMMLPRPLPVVTAIEGGQRVLSTGTGDNGSGGATPDLTAEIYIP